MMKYRSPTTDSYRKWYHSAVTCQTRKTHSLPWALQKRNFSSMTCCRLKIPGTAGVSMYARCWNIPVRSAADRCIRHRRNAEKRKEQPAPAMDRQCHRPCWNHIRHPWNGVHQQRGNPAETACSHTLFLLRSWNEGLLQILYRHQTEKDHQPHAFSGADAGTPQWKDKAGRGSGTEKEITYTNIFEYNFLENHM